jgi:DNA-binding transcriptional LysR family regulator
MRCDPTAIPARSSFTSAWAVAMEWGDMRIFLAVARTGALGSAARALQLSHPTVGRRIRALEEDAGQVLFQRTSEGLLLTDAGQTILPLAEEMEASALAMERRLAGESGQPEGALRISTADWFGAYVLPPVLAELAQRFPRLVSELIASPRQFDLSRREADIAFRIVPFSSPDIVQRRLMWMRYGLYIADALPDPQEGDGRGAGVITINAAQNHFPDVAWLQRMLPNATVAFRSNSRIVQAQMCAKGLGLAVLPRPVGDRLPGIRRLEFGESPPSREIWMGYHRDLRRMDRLRAFADVAVSVLVDDGLA